MLLSFCICGLCKFILKYIINIINILHLLVFDNLISNCCRDFGNRNGVKQDYIMALGIMFGLVNGSSRLLWGYLMDKFGFKPLMSVIACIEIIIAGSFYFIVKYDILYIISVLMIAACIGGHFSILAPLFNKVYGVAIGPQTYGICGFFIGVSNMSGPLLCMFFLKENKDFLIAFLFGGSLVLIKIFCLCIFDENEKFNFDEIKDNNLSKIERETKGDEEEEKNEKKPDETVHNEKEE